LKAEISWRRQNFCASSLSALRLRRVKEGLLTPCIRIMKKIKGPWRERTMRLTKEILINKEKGFENPYSYVVVVKHMVVAESFELVIKSMHKEEEGIEYIQQKNKILKEIMQVKIKYEDVNYNESI